MRIHIVKRENCSLLQKCGLYAGAAVIALLLCGVLLLSIGVNPLEYYFEMFTLGTLGNPIAYNTFTINWGNTGYIRLNNIQLF